jgi:hypothetical protein
MPGTYWQDLMRHVVSGRRWLVALDVLVPATREAQGFLELGAMDVFVIGGSRGTGPLSPLEGVKVVDLGATGVDMMGGIRAAEGAIDAVPAAVQRAVDQWDPERAALTYRTFFSAGRPVAQRPCFGGRPQAWQALEDKTTVDSLWSAAGVSMAPQRVVEFTTQAVCDAALALDVGHGTVWAGDNTDGFNGGAAYTRWVRDSESRERALSFFEGRVEHIRVMPFLEGLPCSIHGIVCPGDEHIVTLRPMEMVVVRGPDGFKYAGAAGTWLPSDSVRAEMRDIARRVGEQLRSEHGYRGCFTVDGVMTERGFRPTELNPRFGAGLSVFTGAQLPLPLMHAAMVEGVPLQWRSRALEASLLANAERLTGARAHLVVHRKVTEEAELDVVFDAGGTARPAGDAEPRDVHLRLGPAAHGGHLFARFERVEMGPPMAPRLAAVAALADEIWDTGFGPLEAAPVLDQTQQ